MNSKWTAPKPVLEKKQDTDLTPQIVYRYKTHTDHDQSAKYSNQKYNRNDTDDSDDEFDREAQMNMFMCMCCGKYRMSLEHI